MRKLVNKQIGTISLFLSLILVLIVTSLSQIVSADGVAGSPVLGNNSYFLHSNGSILFPNLFLNTIAPAEIATKFKPQKFKDSGGVDFNRGNLWKEIGTWKTSSVGTDIVLTGLSPLHVWVVLKNSDDIGTQFDLRADIIKKSGASESIVASNLTRCIIGVGRSPHKAKEIIVGLGDVPDASFATGDVMFLRIFTRIGTRPDNKKCFPPKGGAHNNAVGLSVYHDSKSRPARFGANFTSGGAPPPPLP